MCPKYVLLEVSRKPFLEHFLQMFSELSTQKNEWQTCLPGDSTHLLIPFPWRSPTTFPNGHVFTFPQKSWHNESPGTSSRCFFKRFSPMGIPTICFQQQRSNGPIYPARHPWLKPPMWRPRQRPEIHRYNKRLWLRYYPFILDENLCPVCPSTWNPLMGPLVLIEVWALFWGEKTFKNRGHLGSRYIEYICLVVHLS